MVEHKNYMLFMMSLMTDYSKKIVYSVNQGEREYEGIQTNEALTKYLIDLLAQKNEKMDKIFMLCTPEVMQRPINVVGGITTYVYYSSQIIRFLAERYGIGEKEARDILVEIPYDPVENVSHNDLFSAIETVVSRLESANKETQGRLFVDFTGGVRNSAMALVFACRILSNKGIGVERIFYSNISRDQNGRGIIEDSTATYSAFAEFELKTRVEVGDYSGAKELLEKNETLSEVSRQDVKDFIEHQQDLSDKEKTFQYEEEKKTAEYFVKMAEEKEEKSSSVILKDMYQGSKQEAEQRTRPGDDPALESVKKLLKKSSNIEYAKEVITNFRKQGILFLYKKGYIEVNKIYKDNKGFLKEDNAMTELLAAYQYYMGVYDSDGELLVHGVKDALKDFIGLLCNNLQLSPSEVWNIWKQNLEKDVAACIDRVDDKGFKNYKQFQWSFSHNGYSRRQTRPTVLAYVNKMIEREKCEREPSDDAREKFREYVELFDRTDRVLMKYGFPFFCTYSNKFYDSYDQRYEQRFAGLVKSLDQIYHGEHNELWNEVVKEYFPSKEPKYEEFLQIIRENLDNLMLFLIPFQTVNIKKGRRVTETRNGGKAAEWEKVMYQFAADVDSIRKVRNNIAHPSKIEIEEIYKAVELIRKNVSLIENDFRTKTK